MTKQNRLNTHSNISIFGLVVLATILILFYVINVSKHTFGHIILYAL